MKKVLFYVFLGGFFSITSMVPVGAETQVVAVEEAHYANIPDPWEPVNRVVFTFNEVLNRTLLDPVTFVYKELTPNVMQTGVNNALYNLWTPVYVINNLLQGKVEEAGVNIASFILNTLFGFFGVYDVASDVGLDNNKEDFGQTLGVWGMHSGPYLVLPIIGPSSFRDTAGLGVDFFLDPTAMIIKNNWHGDYNYARDGAILLSAKADTLEAVESLRETSVDWYATMRTLYAQSRHGKVHDGNIPIDNQGPEVFIDEDIF